MTAHGAPASVSGVIRDTQGTPQVGAMVQLLRSDASVVASSFTDLHGHFQIRRIDPGTYQLKAMATSFLPALRENLKVRSNTVVNLTLTTLFEAAQWLPVQKRPANEDDEDWLWTLRSSANRPLLRMLEDGPLVVMEEGNGRGQPLRARVTLGTGAHAFGQGGLRDRIEVDHSSRDDRQLIARADFAAGGSSAFDSMIGLRRDFSPGHTMRTVLAVDDQPGIQGLPGQQGLRSLTLRTSDTFKITDGISAEAGNEFEAIQLGRILVSSHPFAAVKWSRGDDTLSYRMATSRGLQYAAGVEDAGSAPPLVAELDGNLRVERGLHQQVGFAHNTGAVRVEVVVFGDRMTNPVLNGGGRLSPVDASGGDLLYDGANGLIRASGPDYTTVGFAGEMSSRLPANTWVSFSFADGDAVALNHAAAGLSLGEVLSGLHAQRAQMYAIALNGKVDRTGTRWKTSYRTQTSDTVTAVAPFDGSLPDAYLTIYIRQPIRSGRVLPGGVEALVDIRNLLAQGYRPFVTRDGSTLYLAQAERSIQAGLSFTF